MADAVFPGWRLFPPQFFLSHSYADREALAALKAALPKRVKPYVFAPIAVTPEQRVSDDLVRALSASYGLIYLEGGASASSFWVAFERRFALRKNKRVISFNPETGVFARPALTPIDPSCAFVWNGAGTGDTDVVDAAALWLLERRRFDITASYGKARLNTGALDLKDSMYSLRDKLRAGGVIVLFLSVEALEDDEFYDLRQGETRSYFTSADLLDQLVLIAWTRKPDPERLRKALATHWWKPDLAPLKAAIAASLDESDDKKPIILSANGKMDWPRVDDLMVRAEYAVFKRGGLGRAPVFQAEPITRQDIAAARLPSERPSMM